MGTSLSFPREHKPVELVPLSHCVHLYILHNFDTPITINFTTLSENAGGDRRGATRYIFEGGLIPLNTVQMNETRVSVCVCVCLTLSDPKVSPPPYLDCCSFCFNLKDFDCSEVTRKLFDIIFFLLSTGIKAPKEITFLSPNDSKGKRLLSRAPVRILNPVKEKIKKP